MNNSGNETQPCHMDVFDGWAYPPVFLLGLVLNMVALHVFFTTRATWTGTHIYMLNLSVADLALILFLPFRIYDAFLCLNNESICMLLFSIHYINMYASIFTVTAISIQRYLAVKFPFKTRTWQSKKLAMGVCVAIWVLLLTIYSLFRKTKVPIKQLPCFEGELTSLLLVVLEVVGYLVPLLTIMFCSIQTILVLLKENNEGDATLKKNIVGIVTANLVVFVVCFTPIHIGYTLKYLKVPFEHHFVLFSRWIATSNCFLDSISYYFLLKEFYSEDSRSANANMPLH